MSLSRPLGCSWITVIALILALITPLWFVVPICVIVILLGRALGKVEPE